MILHALLYTDVQVPFLFPQRKVFATVHRECENVGFIFKYMCRAIALTERKSTNTHFTYCTVGKIEAEI